MSEQEICVERDHLILTVVAQLIRIGNRLNVFRDQPVIHVNRFYAVL